MKKLFKITKNIFFAIAVIFILCIAAHQILTIIERKENPVIGQYVTVNGNQMNLCILGEGENTIVLLPGLGTAAPVLDFMPLAKELSKENKVVIVEPFGYGWSDITSAERTIENEVEEIRMALQAAQLSGPYILMPHSISGLHSIFYANTYPDEVAGIIGIDCTLPKMVEYFGEECPQKMPLIAGQLSSIGVMRLITLLAPDNFVSDNCKHYYSEENLNTQKCIASWKASNRNVIDEMNHISDSIAKTHDMTFQNDLPVLLFSSDDSDIPPREDGKTSLSFKETYITNPDLQKVVSLDGPHYLHWTHKDEISSYIHSFLIECYERKDLSDRKPQKSSAWSLPIYLIKDAGLCPNTDDIHHQIKELMSFFLLDTH